MGMYICISTWRTWRTCSKTLVDELEMSCENFHHGFCLPYDYSDDDHSGSTDDSEGGFCSQGVTFDDSGLQEEDSDDGFSLQVCCDSEVGSVDDLVSDDGFNLQAGEHTNGGLSSVDDSESDDESSSSQGDNPNDDFVSEDDSDDECGLGDDLHEAKWIKHYCNNHKILLVGEGDFSFAACLAKSFGSATNMIATSLDSYNFLLRNYGYDAFNNVTYLRINGCKLIHEVDARTMANHEIIGLISFDRIVFNFPHAGFNKSESRQSQIQRHRNLVIHFFVNARRMLSMDGEIHVVHKTNGFFREWRIEELAAISGLQTIEKTKFCLNDYPGYQNKYGFGGNKNFDWNPSMTYKFGLSKFWGNFPINQTLRPC